MCKCTVIQTECFRITTPAYYQSPGLELYVKNIEIREFHSWSADF